MKNFAPEGPCWVTHAGFSNLSHLPENWYLSCLSNSKVKIEAFYEKLCSRKTLLGDPCGFFNFVVAS